ncbi:MAG: glycosyltransferase [Labedaea sp.]
MAHLVFATHTARGHVVPLITVASELTARGHDVTWYTGEPYRRHVERSGARFAGPRSGKLTNYDTMEEDHPEITGMTPVERASWYMDQARALPSEGQYHDLVEIVTGTKADAVVADNGFWAVNLLHDKLGTPWATVCQTAMSLPDPDLGPFGLGLQPGDPLIARIRENNARQGRTAGIFAAARERMNRIRTGLGLPQSEGEPPSPFLFMQATTPSFEYPRRDLPPQVHFVGPLLPKPLPSDSFPSWWAELDGDRPVVLVTQGTLAKVYDDLIAPTVRALAEDDVLVVVTTGREGADIGVHPLPENVRVAGFLPYGELLPKLSVMVTNGGYGAVQQALSHGVPLVLGSISDDKPETNARVDWCGAGIDLRTQRPSQEEVGAAVRKVLSDQAYRQGARRIADEFARYDGPVLAADLLERLIATREPVLR